MIVIEDIEGFLNDNVTSSFAKLCAISILFVPQDKQVPEGGNETEKEDKKKPPKKGSWNRITIFEPCLQVPKILRTFSNMVR